LAWTADAESLVMGISIIKPTNTEKPSNVTNARIGLISHVSVMEERVTLPEIQVLSVTFAIQDIFYLYGFLNASK
jgi:hypothetical protein